MASKLKTAARFITTPIFYVNAAPHIGHLYSMVLADVSHRFSLFNGVRSILSTGTDEHGMKVARAAALEHKEPKAFVDELSAKFRILASAADIDFKRFVRTTDSDHVDEAMSMWHRLQARGWIYKDKHSGWYCVSDETFYPESELTEVDGKKFSQESGNPVEWHEEENWFFRLSDMQSRLVELFESRPDFVVPSARYRSLLKDLKSIPLQDLSISRPISRCEWGIPVPGMSNEKISSNKLNENSNEKFDSAPPPTDTIYVWFEALVNYLTVARSSSSDKTLEPWWPATHIIGKDIIRFHALYWPAFLMAADLSPPRQVVVHSHWTLEGNKMSKSKQNVVDPFKCIDEYGLDSVRYVLCHDSSLAHDSPFSFERLIERHNVNLVNKWFNLASRVGGAKFNIPQSLKTWSNEGLPGLNSLQVHGNEDLREQCARFAASYEFGRYAQVINDAGMNANVAFQSAEPWLNPNHTNSQCATALASDTCRVMALLLQPICPTYSKNMLDNLGVSELKRTWEYAKLGADLDYGNGSKGTTLKRLSVKV